MGFGDEHDLNSKEEELQVKDSENKSREPETADTIRNEGGGNLKCYM